MLAIILSSTLWSNPAAAASYPSPSAAFVEAGETHLRRALEPDHPQDEFEEAHKNFESAYLVAEDAQYLCRALATADLALHHARFSDEQERLSWEERQREDLDQLREDAIEKKRPNCRFDAEGKPAPPRVALLSDADSPAANSSSSTPAASAVEPTPASTPGVPATQIPGASELPKPSQMPTTRGTRAKTVSGSILTVSGAGLLAGVAAVVGLGVLSRADEMQGLVDRARTEQRKFTPAENLRFHELKDELLHQRDVAIGLGVAGLVSLGTGVALLVTRKKSPGGRKYAIQPYGGPLGAGAVLRLGF